MSISLQTNVTSLFAEQALNQNTTLEGQAIEQLSSGYRINSSGDDAAGLAVANQYRSTIAELQQGVLNASNGTSSLQIIDGGLNNISTILDRLQTLATESASATFAGNRNTLNQEYQTDVAEITRQANNIGLAAGGQYNGINSVFIGGGNDAANGQVSINLSGAQNQVDATGLGLATTSVAAGGTELTGGTANTIRLDAPGATFLSAHAQTFTFNIYSANGGAQTQTISVGGTGTGLTETQVLGSLNSQLSAYGISATVGANGQLSFGGGTPFTVVTNTTADANPIATIGSEASNSGVYDVNGAATALFPGETLTIQNGQGTATVTLATTDNLASALSKINAQTSSLGVYAIANAAGTGISLQSVNNFTASSTSAVGVFGSTTPATVTPASTGTVTGNAVAALTAITNAISALGLVQGTVGAGENLLNYATSLANSQITNFSSAESSIRDADVATAAANLTQAQTLLQSTIAALAQANAAPSAILKLLQQ
jgi:flagellin